MKTRSSGFSSRLNAKHLALALLIIVLATYVAMHTINTSPLSVYSPERPDVSPYGYTWSLILFALPSHILLLWYWLNRNHDLFPYHGKAFLITALMVLSGYFLLDIFFANTFFRFPNKDAILGVFLWGWDFKEKEWVKNIPIEEFFFYELGFAAILLCYGWSSRTLFSRYTLFGKAYDRAAKKMDGAIRYSPLPLALGVFFCLLAVAYKKVEGLPGFPGYFFLLTALVVTPSFIFYQAVKNFVNIQAFTFTILALLLVSLLWEVTLALPYGWWNFQDRAMVGIYVFPWSRLPIEEPLLWMAAGWLNVTLFELVRLYLAQRKLQQKSLREFLFGRKTLIPAPPRSGVTRPTAAGDTNP